MQAWQFEAFGGPEKLARHEVERPAPGPGEALVRVTYCGVNPIDRSVGAGRFPWIALPHTPGAEIVGVLEAVGPGPANEAPPLGTPVALAFRIFCGRCYYCLRGHEEACIADPRGANAPVAIGVTAPGGWAEYVLAPAKNCLPLPPGLAAEIACTAVVDGTTAWHLLDRARVAPDERVLVVGATGGVGLYALQIARQRGALVAAIAGGAEKAAALREFGPDLLLDRTRDDVVARVREWTGGRGVDVAIDPVGAATWDASLATLAPLGRYATCGVLTGAEVKLNLAPLYAQEQEIVGSTGGTRADLQQVLEGLAAGRLRAAIWRTFPFAEAREALAALGAEDRVGKLLLHVS
ncbi:MAG TPA: zinc-binding dehydrogenase [Chloroflexota bacterium]|nr:zinc-binding dehydrogenase [Chloroflexota bacterium]